ncbi:MAG: transglycosylase SLT domain-containing protein [Methylobacter sp.]|nr:transglycosylase SLT domain-containing protein [Methylobacter sp.]
MNMKDLAWLVLLCCLVFFPVVASSNKLDMQRSDFLQAEKLIAQGKTSAFLESSASLRDYPLYPYLQYQWLKDNLQYEDKVHAFLSTYKETRYAESLKVRWLGQLASNERWHEFLQHYIPTENSELECQYNLALYNTGNKHKALDAAKRLWARGDSLIKECDPLLSILRMSPFFTTDLVWQRFEAALKKDNVQLAEYVLRLLDKEDQYVADIWLQVHNKPSLIEDSDFLNRNHKQSGSIFAHGVDRLAESDLDLAVEIWDDRKQYFQIDNQTIQQMERDLAFSLARKRHEGAYQRLSQLVVFDSEVREWRVRAALYEQNWQYVAEALAGLTADERQEPRWQYWQARVLDKMGDTLQAQNVYNKVAEDRSFYGFLAADSARKSYSLSNKPVSLAGNKLEKLANEDDFKVVRELRFHNRDMEAQRQWWYAVKKLSKERRMVAAKLAQQWQWDQIAINTLIKADYWDDLTLRFPVHYSDQIHNNAYQQNLDPAIIFGLIRQESLFDKDAESSVGARGLMQIMPKTGMQIARELKEKWQSDESLFNPDINVKYGAFYYKQLLKRFHGHFALATAAYNAGPARVAKWLPSVEAVPADIWVETIPYRETRKYVTAVLSYAIIYQQLIQRKGLQMKELMLDVLPG